MPASWKSCDGDSNNSWSSLNSSKESGKKIGWTWEVSRRPEATDCYSIYSQDIDMEFDTEKCDLFLMEIGKWEYTVKI